MIKKHNFCGIECEFSELSSMWEFFNFEGIDFDSYVFWTIDEAVYSKGRRIGMPTKFEPQYFKELVNASFVAERLILHLYSDTTCARDIDHYEDYLQSNCQMIILIYDCYYIEVYCKNPTWLELLFQASQKIPGALVDKKYEDTDTRTGMYV